MAEEKHTTMGLELIEAMQEVAAHVRGDIELPTRVAPAKTVHVPERVDVAAIRRRLRLSQSDFADRFGLALSTVRDWEQGRRRPDRAARVLLRTIEREDEAVARALQAP